MDAIAQKLTQMDEEKRLYGLHHMVKHFVVAQKFEWAQQLLTSLDFITMKIATLQVENGVNQLLEDYDTVTSVNKDTMLLSLASAVRLSATALTQDAKQTFPQLYSRLISDPMPALRILLDTYKPSYCWLQMYSKSMISIESSLIRSLIGHEESVSDCKLSNNGTLVLSASSDRTLRIWDIATGLCKHILRGHTDEVNACSLSGDGRFALSASTDKTLRLWDVEKGECLRVLQGHTDKVTGCALNADGSLAVSSSYDQTVRVWDIQADTSFALSGHEERVTCCDLDAAGRLVLSGSYDKTLRLWNIASQECLAVIENEFGGMTHCALSGDGRVALSKCILYLIEFENWDPETGDTPVSVFYNPDKKDLEELKGNEDDFFSALVSVIMGTGITRDLFRQDAIISVWDLSSGKCIRKLGEELRSSISDFELDKDEKLVISSSSGDGSIRIWSLETGQCITSMFEITAGVSSCAINSANHVAISSSNDGDLHVWSIAASPTSTDPTVQASTVSTIFACAYDQAGDIAISASSDKDFYLWNARTGEQISHTLTTDFRSTGDVTLSVERRIALMEPSFLTIKEEREKNGPIVFDIQNGQIIRVLPGQSELIHKFSLAPAGIQEQIRDYTRFIGDKTHDFVGREFIFEAVTRFIETQPRGYFFIRGDPGIGKSALAAQMVRLHGYVHHFNSRNEGINKTESFLRNICAQLIVAYKLDYAFLPPDTTQDAGFLMRLLGEISDKLKANEKAVIVVDALDEVDMIGQSPDANTLYLPVLLPHNVYVVVTTRKMPLNLRIDCEQGTLDIEHNSAGNIADIHEYVVRNVTLPGIQAYITKQKSDNEQFINYLVQKSEGNFMYLHYVLPEIEHGAYTDRDLETLPVGLLNYYDDHWRRMRGENEEDWFRYKLPIIMALTIIKEPVSIDLIADFSEVQERARIREVLHDWSQFLHEDQVLYKNSSQKRYYVYHSSFHDFIAKKEEVDDERVSRKAASEKIADLYGLELFDDKQ